VIVSDCIQFCVLAYNCYVDQKYRCYSGNSVTGSNWRWFLPFVPAGVASDDPIAIPVDLLFRRLVTASNWACWYVIVDRWTLWLHYCCYCAHWIIVPSQWLLIVPRQLLIIVIDYWHCYYWWRARRQPIVYCCYLCHCYSIETQIVVTSNATPFAWPIGQNIVDWHYASIMITICYWLTLDYSQLPLCWKPSLEHFYSIDRNPKPYLLPIEGSLPIPRHSWWWFNMINEWMTKDDEIIPTEQSN